MARTVRRPAVPRGEVTTITRRGQTVVPARVRRELGLREGSKLRWLAGVTSIVVVPVPEDAIEAVAGKYRGEGLLKRLLAERRRDRTREKD